MKLIDAYKIIEEFDTSTYIHIDHVCPDPDPHMIDRCIYPSWEQLTEEEAESYTEETLRQKLKDIWYGR